MSGAISSGMCIIPLNILPPDPDDNRIPVTHVLVGTGACELMPFFSEQQALLHKNETYRLCFFRVIPSDFNLRSSSRIQVITLGIVSSISRKRHKNRGVSQHMCWHGPEVPQTRHLDITKTRKPTRLLTNTKIENGYC
jgi:hypothetical protein